ncbi:MAG: co-chaperone GroES [Gammaproteobacteria bacterium]|nr:co-chaperone GroES [Gammaproteobacteria bacterium]MDE0248699.1 co-chaperone GroES [Gammaproteobacteria bacterium]MDE0394566.1 co-chaperone GroES [Gammaproteobacteria bacterium]
MANKIQPLSDRVVVQALDEAQQTRGGLYIPDTAKEKPQQGTVVSVGPGKLSDQGERLAPDVKAGDTVLYGKYSGTEVTVDGDDYLILRESDILAVIG